MPSIKLGKNEFRKFNLERILNNSCLKKEKKTITQKSLRYLQLFLRRWEYESQPQGQFKPKKEAETVLVPVRYYVKISVSDPDPHGSA